MTLNQFKQKEILEINQQTQEFISRIVGSLIPRLQTEWHHNQYSLQQVQELSEKWPILKNRLMSADKINAVLKELEAKATQILSLKSLFQNVITSGDIYLIDEYLSDSVCKVGRLQGIWEKGFQMYDKKGLKTKHFTNKHNALGTIIFIVPGNQIVFLQRYGELDTEKEIYIPTQNVTAYGIAPYRENLSY